MIDAGEVTEALRRCLFNDEEAAGLAPGEAPEGAVIVEGILNPFGFHAERLEAERDRVKAWLADLPVAFLSVEAGGGGGMSFLNACMTRDDVQWTGLHKVQDELLSLGQALGYVKCLLPREMWGALPGGMPYYVVSGDVFVPDENEHTTEVES